MDNKAKFRKAAAATTLALLVALQILRALIPAPKIDIAVPDTFKPGSEFPLHAHCDEFYYDFVRVNCYGTSTRLMFIFNRVQGVIENTTLYLSGYRIGDLILAWGNPTGVIFYWKGVTQVFWGNKSVWVTGKFIPEAKAILYQEYLSPPATRLWRGFTTVDY